MEYFGEEIGFYFAFLGHLVYSLIPLVPISLALASWQFAEFDYLRKEDAKTDDCDDDIKPVSRPATPDGDGYKPEEYSGYSVSNYSTSKYEVSEYQCGEYRSVYD